MKEKNTMPSTKIKILAVKGLVLLCSCVLLPRAQSAENNTVKITAKGIAKEKGILKPKEVQVWKSKAIPKDWLTIDNKYFSVSYPSCFNIQGEEGESDPKISSSIVFKRESTCPGFMKEYGDGNLFTIAYFYAGGLTSIDNAGTADYSLLQQKINLNGSDAVLFAGLLDSNQLQLRWQIFAMCKGKAFRLVTELPAGEVSVERVNKNNYDFPEDFKKIASTFKCK